MTTLLTPDADVPAQRWHCRTRVDELTIPSGLARVDLAELERLAELQGRDDLGRTAGEAQAALLRRLGVAGGAREAEGNLLVYGGASVQWQTLLGNGTTTAGQSLTFFNNTNAAIGVGDSSTAAAATQTDLQASTNKLRVAMSATYPQHTDGVIVGAASVVFQAAFSTGQANYAWQEWAIFNSSTAGVGRMLQRKVENLGTKTSSSIWTLTLTLSLA